jgi:peptide/nickel transport system substrate-binding protein
MNVRHALPILAAVVLVLAGCGGDGDDNEGGGGATSLTVAVPDDAATFDPLFATTPRSTQVIMNAYDPYMIHPLKEGEDGVRVFDAEQVEGLTAESLEVSADGRTWTLKIKEGLTFPDGQPINAEAVKWSFERNFNVEGSGGAFMYGQIAGIPNLESVKVVDDMTLEVTTAQPNPLIPKIFVLSNSVPFNMDALKNEHPEPDGYGSNWLKRNTTGSGPYVLERWTAGQEIVLRANEDYHRGAPTIKDVTINIVPSAATRMALLERGEVDIVEKLSAEEINSVSEADNVKIISVPSSNQVQLVMNQKEEPFTNLAVRRAIAHAVPYGAIMKDVYFDRARPAAGPIPVDFPLHDPGDYPYAEQDLDAARQALQQAGVENLSVDFQIDSGNPDHEAIAVLVQGALQEIGIRTTIQKLTPAVFAERRAKRTLTFFLNEGSWWVTDPAYAVGLSYLCEAFFNYGVYCNKAIDRLWAQARVELDEGRRADLFAQIQQQVIEDVPMAWITHANYNLAVRDNISGYAHFNDEMLRFYYLEKSD